VKELAGDGVPVTVTCRVLKLARQRYYRWLDKPVADAVLEEAYRANALFDAHREDPEFGYRFLADEARGVGTRMADGFLRTAELDDVEQAARDQGVTARRRQGYTLRVTVVPAVHHRLLALCGPLDGAPAAPAVPAQRKARREYENRVSTLALIGP
jgi:hypothetical protein